MKIERLRKSHKKEIIIGIILTVVIGGALTFNLTHSKYRVTQSIDLATGTINYSPADFQVMAVKLSEDGTNYISQSDIPTHGYTFNAEKSKCRIPTSTQTGENAPVAEGVTIEYVNDRINFLGINKQNTKCYLYFDKILDNESPIVNSITTESTKTEITVTVNATDNFSIAEYWYSIDNGPYIQETSATPNIHTFTGLTSNTTHTIKVYVKDTTGNASEINTKENVKTKIDGITITSHPDNESNIEYHYIYNGQNYTLNSNDAEWIIPIGATFVYNKNSWSVTFYSGAKELSSTMLNCVGKTVTITGEETQFKAWKCFTGDTEILAYDEKKKRKLKRKVKDFKIGDKLYTFDEKQNKYVVTAIKKIEEIHTRDIYAIYLENGEVFRCSEGHAFYVAGASYMQARDLKVGYELLGMEGNIKIAKIEQEHYPDEITLYNLYLDNNTNCFVTGAKVLSCMMLLTTTNAIKKLEVVAVTTGTICSQ